MSAGTRLCAYCRERPLTGTSRRYCDECRTAGKSAASKAAKRKPCGRCGGPKGEGVGVGARFCAPCREARAPIGEQYEIDRQRQLELIENERVLLDGRPRRMAAPSTVPDGQKWCSRCQRFLPVANFPPRGKNGKVRSLCIPCQRSYSHERNLRVTFGITPERYAEMYDAQGGRCAICLRRPRTSRLAVDHDHKTDEIRGLLCYRCNKQVLGHAMESPSLLRRAANYLEAPPARTKQPLESLDHFDGQAAHGFQDDAEHVENGAVVMDASGEMVAVTFETFVALAQVAGCALVVEGRRFEPADQMTTEDLLLLEKVWQSYQRQTRGSVA